MISPVAAFQKPYPRFTGVLARNTDALIPALTTEFTSTAPKAGLLIALMHRVGQWRGQQRYEKAQRLQQEALAMELRPGWTVAREIAYDYVRHGEELKNPLYKKAVELLEESLSLLTKASLITHASVAQLHEQLGALCASNIEKAQGHLQAALEIRKAVLGPESMEVLKSYVELGRFHYLSSQRFHGRYTFDGQPKELPEGKYHHMEGIEALEQAMKLGKKIFPTKKGTTEVVQLCLNIAQGAGYLSQLYAWEKQPAKAEQGYHLALQVVDGLVPPGDELRKDAARSLHNHYSHYGLKSGHYHDSSLRPVLLDMGWENQQGFTYNDVLANMIGPDALKPLLSGSAVGFLE